MVFDKGGGGERGVKTYFGNAQIEGCFLFSGFPKQRFFCKIIHLFEYTWIW